MAVGDQLHAELNARDALMVFEELLFDTPRSYDLLWRAARESVNLGILADEDRERKGRFRQGETYGRLAVGADPGGVAGHYWLATALMRQALLSNPREKANLSGEILHEGNAVLALEPNHAGALHIVGQWHAEMMRLTGVAHFMAVKVLGGDGLRDASWEKAEELLSRSAELEPAVLVHHLELARLFVDTKRTHEALGALQEVLARPALEPADLKFKKEAEALLAALVG